MHGAGVYLTSVSPDQGKKKILHNNYGVNVSTVKKERANFFFKFELGSLQNAQKVGGDRCGEDIWVQRQIINLLPGVCYGIFSKP